MSLESCLLPARVRSTYYLAPCFNTDGRRQTCSKTVSKQFVPAQYWRNRAIKWKLTITIYFDIVRDNYIVCDGATRGHGLLMVILCDGVKPVLLLLKVVKDFRDFATCWGVPFFLTTFPIISFWQVWQVFFWSSWTLLLCFMRLEGLSTKSTKNGHDASHQLYIIYSADLYLCFV